MNDLAMPLKVRQSLQAEHDCEQQFGFWLYLMSDAVLFALLFATWASMSPAISDGVSIREHLNLSTAFIESLLLLTSTLSCGLAQLSFSATTSKARGMTLAWLLVTAVLGTSFVFLEFREFGELIRHHAGPDVNGTLSAFFVLVGTHGLHVSVGLLWLLSMMGQILRYGQVPVVMSRLHRFSLFWHFLDLIWVGIFSFVYLAEHV